MSALNNPQLQSENNVFLDESGYNAMFELTNCRIKCTNHVKKLYMQIEKAKLKALEQTVIITEPTDDLKLKIQTLKNPFEDYRPKPARKIQDMKKQLNDCHDVLQILQKMQKCPILQIIDSDK